MGSRELIESLRAAGEQKVRALRAEAEQEAERVRADAAAAVAAVRARRERERTAEAERNAEVLVTRAHAAARRLRIGSERALADRLRRLAEASLPHLRNVGYEGVFTAFVRELPALAWGTVRVHPSDVRLAEARFPGAEVVPDPDISGGLAVLSEDGSIQVVNTFEKRLERLWEDLLPEIMQEVLEQCG